MAYTAQTLADGQLGTSKATIYTATGPTIIRLMSVYNTNATSQTVNLYLKRSGGTSRQIHQAGLAQYESLSILDIGGILILSNGDEIEADTTTGTAVDYVIAGAK